MAKNTDERKARAVPSSRIGRVGRLGALAGKIAGNVVTNGASLSLIHISEPTRPY